MKRSPHLLLFFLFFGIFAATTVRAQQQPVVSDIQVSQRAASKLVDISYDLACESGTVTVWVDVSADGGRSYIVKARTFSGDVGQGITAGANKQIVWDAGADFDGALVENARVRVTAYAGAVPIPPVGMVFIPGGHFMMGDGDTGVGARQVYISPMFMDRYEVRGALWDSVFAWGEANGYLIGGASKKGPDHPAYRVTWFEAVKWCNARSEMEGLTPVYYTDEAQMEVYRSDDVWLTNAMVKWDADGYRLPTEAEWEKAARGGLTGKEYPWGDTIDGSMANYWDSGDPFEAGSSPYTTPVGYYNGGQTPAGADMAKGYGLYDMAGNLWEWCWDKTSSSLTGETNPHGPDSGSGRLLRGGTYGTDVSYLPCAYRQLGYGASTDHIDVGFRCVRSL